MQGYKKTMSIHIQTVAYGNLSCENRFTCLEKRLFTIIITNHFEVSEVNQAILFLCYSIGHDAI